MSNRYQPIPSSDDSSTSSVSPESVDHAPRDRSDRPLRAAVEAEFNRPPPAWYKRALLIGAIVFMAWLASKLGGIGREKKPEIIYANRQVYSEEFKYRPAASPVITEYLKDGRIRLRGANPGGVGVREEDMPLTPAKKAFEEKKRVEEAREAAKAKLGLKSRKSRGKKGKNGRKGV